MADFYDEDDKLFIFDQTDESIVTYAIAPCSLKRKIGFAESTWVFLRFQMFGDVFFNIALGCSPELGKLLFGGRIKENLPFHRLYFFLISAMGIG